MRLPQLCRPSFPAFKCDRKRNSGSASLNFSSITLTPTNLFTNSPLTITSLATNSATNFTVHYRALSRTGSVPHIRMFLN